MMPNGAQSAPARRRGAWWKLSIGLLASILIPFAFLAGYFDQAAEAMKGLQGNPPLLFGAVVGLLVLDILLPVPSSVVLAFSGYALGFGLGFVANWLGLTASLLFGHWLGRRAAPWLERRVLGAEQRAQLDRAMGRWGFWAIAASRPVPVLAEAAAFLAGVSNLPLRETLVHGALANLGLAAVMAAAGAYSHGQDTTLLALGASILVPAIAIGCWRLAMRQR